MLFQHRPIQDSCRLRQHVRGNLATALQFATAGIAVFPCFESGPRSKEPRTRHGHHDATTDIRTIRVWWQRWPGALVGVPVGPPSGIWVLDVDGSCGRASLRELLAHLNLSTIGDLTRVVARTPSGGLHLYFALCDGGALATAPTTLAQASTLVASGRMEPPQAMSLHPVPSCPMAVPMSGSTPPFSQVWGSAHDLVVRRSASPAWSSLSRYILQARAYRDCVFTGPHSGHPCRFAGPLASHPESAPGSATGRSPRSYGYLCL
jgi:Bifunctional DNA primase/polymerase, N-terminal